MSVCFRQELFLETPEQTHACANQLGRLLACGHCLALCGPLGAGKTLFAKAAAEGMGLPQGLLSSPSFAIVHSHESPCGLVSHADFYRVESLDELYMAGVFEFDWLSGVSFIEWADKFPAALPEAFLLLCFAFVEGAPQARQLFASAHGEKHTRLLKNWISFLKNEP